MHPPGRNQPGIEKCATGINSSGDDLPGNQNQDIPNPEPVVIPPSKPPEAKKTRWTKEEYKTILRAFYNTQKNIDSIHQLNNFTMEPFYTYFLLTFFTHFLYSKR